MRIENLNLWSDERTIRQVGTQSFLLVDVIGSSVSGIIESLPVKTVDKVMANELIGNVEVGRKDDRYLSCYPERCRCVPNTHDKISSKGDVVEM